MRYAEILHRGILRVALAALVGGLIVGCASTSIQDGDGQRRQGDKITERARAIIQACAVAKPDYWTCKVPSFWRNPVGAVSAALEEAGVSSRLEGNREDMISILLRNGFLKVEPSSESDVLPGTVIVYLGQSTLVEVKGSDGMYYSNQARAGSAFDHEIEIPGSVDVDDEQNVVVRTQKLKNDSFYAFVKPSN